MAHRGADLGGVGALGEPDRLHGADRQRCERLHEGAAEGAVADMQGFERLNGSPELPHDLETRARPAVS
jgi:hypothetical protein